MRRGMEVAAGACRMVDAKNRSRLPRAARLAAQRGVSSIEYALLTLGVIAIFGVVIVLLEGGIMGLLGNVSDRITAAAT